MQQNLSYFMYNSIGQLCHSSYYTFRRMHEQSIYDLRHKFMINIGHMHINMICYVCPTHWCTKIRVAINLDYVSNIARSGCRVMRPIVTSAELAEPVRLVRPKPDHFFSANSVMIVTFTNDICMNVVMIVTISMMML